MIVKDERELELLIDKGQVNKVISSLDELKKVLNTYPSLRKEILESIAADIKLIKLLIPANPDAKEFLKIVEYNPSERSMALYNDKSIDTQEKLFAIYLDPEMKILSSSALLIEHPINFFNKYITRCSGILRI